MGVRVAIVVAVLALGQQVADQRPPQEPQPPRPPVFRAGAHYVRVDAYPTSRDGRILEGLTRDDFEIYEDGRLQAIENAEFVSFPSWTPEAERKDPRTQEEGYALAADAAYRVFAVVIDRDAFDMVGWNVMHRPLVDFLERTLGPRDLFGLLHTKNEWTDLVLGQKTTTARMDLNKPEWWTTRDQYDEYEWTLLSCGLETLIPASRADRAYTLLEGLVRLLGAIREERKSIIYVADGLPSSGGGRTSPGGSMPEIPRVGVTPGGRLGPMPRDVIGGGSTSSYCNTERLRLGSLDLGERFRDLLKSARTSNVAFYPISPKGLQGIEFTREGRADLAGFRRGQRRLDSLLSLASETDGVAIVNTNDLRGGLSRIAHDLQAYYVLGYYTTNTNWDGELRSIKVRLRPKRPSARPGTGETIRARRQYRAPTREEIAAISASLNPAPPVCAGGRACHADAGSNAGRLSGASQGGAAARGSHAPDADRQDPDRVGDYRSPRSADGPRPGSYRQAAARGCAGLGAGRPSRGRAADGRVCPWGICARVDGRFGWHRRAQPACLQGPVTCRPHPGWSCLFSRSRW